VPLLAGGFIACSGETVVSLLDTGDSGLGGRAGEGHSDGGSSADGGTGGLGAGSGVAGGSAGGAGPMPVGCVVIDYTDGEVPLTDYQILFTLNTTILIAADQLHTDCSDLRVLSGPGSSTVLPTWIPRHTCERLSTHVWIRVPEIRPGETVSLRVEAGDSGVATEWSGEDVFEFFDGFDGVELDGDRWVQFGSGSVSLDDGLLSSTGPVLLQSEAPELGSDSRVLGVRIRAEGSEGTEVDLGAGVVTATSGDTLSAFDRTWDGVVFTSADATALVVDGEAGTPCDDASFSRDLVVSVPWAYTEDTGPVGFLTAEFGYEQLADATRAWLITSRDYSVTATHDEVCSLPEPLPVLLELDHTGGGHLPTQQVDYVYVRQQAEVEPTVQVLSACAVEPTGPDPVP
jgi:hypothetical protein